MIGYKAFKLRNGNHLFCKKYKFKLNQVNKYNDEIEIWKSGFHFCKELKDVFNSYPLEHKHHNYIYYKVESGDNVITCKNKLVTDEIKILKKVNNNYLYNEYIKNYEFASLEFVPEEYKTRELCEIAVKRYGYLLKFVPEKYKTRELYEIAVKEYGYNLEYVPEEHKTEKLCEIAVKQHGTNLKHVPEKYKTKELCEIAVKKNGDSLLYVPEKYKPRRELCVIM